MAVLERDVLYAQENYPTAVCDVFSAEVIYLKGEFDGSSRDLCLNIGGRSADVKDGSVSMKPSGGPSNSCSLAKHLSSQFSTARSAECNSGEVPARSTSHKE